jgi:hypothetical protein
MNQNREIEIGDLVVCRLTKRVGRIGQMLEAANRARRYYVQWQGKTPDFSLMSADEFVILDRTPSARSE